jgi:hypothetical protein
MSAAFESTVTINSDTPGLKKILANLMSQAKCLGRIEHVSARSTKMTIQGPKDELSAFIDSLQDLLRFQLNEEEIYLATSELTPVPDNKRLDSITIYKTQPTVKRSTSSGSNEFNLAAKLPLGASANPENITTFGFATKATMSVIEAVQTRARSLGVDSISSFPVVAERPIKLRHRSLAALRQLDVSFIATLADLYLKVGAELELVVPVKALYHRSNDGLLVITKVADLQADLVYDVYSKFDTLPTEVIIAVILMR